MNEIIQTLRENTFLRVLVIVLISNLLSIVIFKIITNIVVNRQMKKDKKKSKTNFRRFLIAKTKLHEIIIREKTLNEKRNTNFWTDEKVIEFLNWYIELHKLNFVYTLENKSIIESFKNGDDVSVWETPFSKK